jgi:hypothetical protein
MERIRHDFEAAGIHFDDAFFRPTRKLVAWEPFKDALFHPLQKQPDRRIVLSDNEIYVCKNNEWTFSTIITSEKGKQFIGYVMKQMESLLRKVMKYKYKLTAGTEMVHEDTIRVLEKKGLFIEKIVTDAVLKFHREATKTVVIVDSAELGRIRQEALITQEALIVEDQFNTLDCFTPFAMTKNEASEIAPLNVEHVSNQKLFEDYTDEDPVSEQILSGDGAPDPVSSGWERLGDDLSEQELRALFVLLQGEDIKLFADKCGIMLEVLMDGINGKAMDYIGDNLMDEAFVLYDDYINQVKAYCSYERTFSF